jgi:hypothetical protein
MSVMLRTLLISAVIGAGLSGCTLNLPEQSPPTQVSGPA